MERLVLYQDYRLIEKNEADVNGAWKGAHLLLFFMAFVFGSFCTFCFHTLMYMFDEQCVLFPKLQSITSLKHSVIYEFIPADKDDEDNLPVDFLSTHWQEKSACNLPTYVPLVSAIFGLVWTTLFLMFSSGNRNLITGLQRPWRILLPVFVFSLVMGGVCVHSSYTTHYGLYELCFKLGEITGSKTCTYTVNVATLAYERRIRGVYQAIRLTVVSAWLHTACWLLSALLTLARVLLVVDFNLVCVNVELVGDLDKMLERHETHVRTVSPEGWINENDSDSSERIPIYTPSRVHFEKKKRRGHDNDLKVIYNKESHVHYFSNLHQDISSQFGLLTEEEIRQDLSKDHQFISKMVKNLILNLPIATSSSEIFSTMSLQSSSSESLNIARQYGKELLSIKSNDSLIELHKTKDTAKLMKEYTMPSTSAKSETLSTLNITDEMRKILESQGKRIPETDGKKKMKKSNLKHAGVQTHRTRSDLPKVQITDPEDQDNTLKDRKETTEKVQITDPEDQVNTLKDQKETTEKVQITDPEDQDNTLKDRKETTEKVQITDPEDQVNTLKDQKETTEKVQITDPEGQDNTLKDQKETTEKVQITDPEDQDNTLKDQKETKEKVQITDPEDQDNTTVQTHRTRSDLPKVQITDPEDQDNTLKDRKETTEKVQITDPEDQVNTLKDQKETTEKVKITDPEDQDNTLKDQKETKEKVQITDPEDQDNTLKDQKETKEKVQIADPEDQDNTIKDQKETQEKVQITDPKDQDNTLKDQKETQEKVQITDPEDQDNTLKDKKETKEKQD